jgi:hypothetical protein
VKVEKAIDIYKSLKTKKVMITILLIIITKINFLLIAYNNDIKLRIEKEIAIYVRSIDIINVYLLFLKHKCRKQVLRVGWGVGFRERESEKGGSN